MDGRVGRGGRVREGVDLDLDIDLDLDGDLGMDWDLLVKEEVVVLFVRVGVDEEAVDGREVLIVSNDEELEEGEEEVEELGDGGFRVVPIVDILWVRI